MDTIMIVEDEQGIALLLKYNLENASYSILVQRFLNNDTIRIGYFFESA